MQQFYLVGLDKMPWRFFFCISASALVSDIHRGIPADPISPFGKKLSRRNCIQSVLYGRTPIMAKSQKHLSSIISAIANCRETLKHMGRCPMTADAI